MHDTKFNYHLIIFILKSFTNKHNKMTLIFPFVSVKTCACQVEKALEWVPARAKSAKSVIMQFRWCLHDTGMNFIPERLAWFVSRLHGRSHSGMKML